MTNTKAFAQRELSLLSQTCPDPENRPLIEPFTEEILALCEKFGESGQSGGSAPYVAAALSQAVYKLLTQQPIAPVTGAEEEWVDVSEYCDGRLCYQNSRCSALFKDGTDGKPYYLDAIVWLGEEEYDTFTGKVYVDDKSFDLISSKQHIKFLPFTPKTFYIDTVRVPVSKEEAEGRGFHYIEDGSGECYYTVVKDVKQLEEVFKYYDKYE